MKYFIGIKTLMIYAVAMFFLAACANSEANSINPTETVQGKDIAIPNNDLSVTETPEPSQTHKITQEMMDKLYAYMTYDEMVKQVGFEPALTDSLIRSTCEYFITGQSTYQYYISGEEFEEHDAILRLTFADHGLDDANTGYMDFEYPADTKFVTFDEYSDIEIGDSLEDVRELMGNAMRFNKIWWDEIYIHPKEYQAIVAGKIHAVLHFSNDVLDKKYIVDKTNTDMLKCIEINSETEDFSGIHPGMSIGDIQNILGGQGYIISASSNTDYNEYLWKISDTVGLEVSYDGLGIKIVGEEIRNLD